jgi:hypothetical protein
MSHFVMASYDNYVPRLQLFTRTRTDQPAGAGLREVTLNAAQQRTSAVQPKHNSAVDLNISNIKLIQQQPCGLFDMGQNVMVPTLQYNQ